MADVWGFASEAQRRKWRQMVHEGKVTHAQYTAREDATTEKNLPERTSARHRTVGKSRAPDAAKLGKHRY